MRPMLRVRPIPAEQFRSSGRLLQTRFWARLKTRFGWNPHFFVLSDDESELGHMLLLRRAVAPGFEITYVPDAPPRTVYEQSANSNDATRRIESACAGLLPHLPRRVGFVRVDPQWERGAIAAGTRLRKAAVDVQPPDTVEIDLNRTEDEILKSMRTRSRRNIRKSERCGVVVSASNRIDHWYDLYLETAQRDKIAVHSREYYRAVMTTEDDSVCVELLLAEYDGTAIAGIVVAYCGDQAVYLYGASSNEHRDRMPAYALQWEAIRRAKRRGCRTYDMFGIPPTDDPAHPMHGLYRFKVGFGGRIIHRAGCWDYPARPVAYSVYREAERVRDFYYKTVKKRR